MGGGRTVDLAATSTEYVKITVVPPAGVDLTGTVVKLAILPVTNRDNPAVGDWKTAEWSPAPTARLLIGPGTSTVLTKGDYRVWITFDPIGSENVVVFSGHLSII